MNEKKFYAHTPSRSEPNNWHDLEQHLLRTAKLAFLFAQTFGYGNAAFVLGLFHDLGKVNPAFQQYLQACHRGEIQKSAPHAISGAAYLWKLLLRQNSTTALLAMCVLGHHVGLDAEHAAIVKGGKLDRWWNDPVNDQLKRQMQTVLQHLKVKELERLSDGDLQRELRLRMLFSCLVDADYMDTESHFDPEQSNKRSQWIRPSDLWPIFRANQLQMMWKGRFSGKLNRIRRQIYFSCVQLGSNPPGIFRLTVPTGGGKTRSALAFALRHAVMHKSHGFQRVIVALPYTSIIDQTARVYREIFGDHFVLEHHSQIELPENDQQGEDQVRQRLASENWDFPIIVTTTVQLFESLFANKPGKCRKLHNIARSILILDEVQTLPPELLEPTMDILRTLVNEYGVTLVLSTATQPAFDKTPYLKAFQGCSITEIVPKFEEYFQSLERVEYQPIRQYNALSDLAEELAKPERAQALVILNTRNHALRLHTELQKRGIGKGLYHLSSLLCGAHRKHLLQEIFERLTSDAVLPVRLISTQVVEAGVDLDFPLVYRAMGPLDRIVQAAGRCNREGRLQKGKVVIFDFPDNNSPPGAYRMGLDAAKILLSRNAPERLHKPELHAEYFQMLFRDVNLDKKDIQSYRRDLDYPKVAEKYQLIENTFSVVVPTYDSGEGERRLQDYLRRPSQQSRRRLMSYIVNLSVRDLGRDEIRECLQEVGKGLYRWNGGYDDKTHCGIQGVVRDPADLIA